MSGQALRPRWRLLGFAAAFLAVLGTPTAGGADPSNSGALHAENTRLAARSHAAVLDVYSLDSQIGAAHTRLASLNTQAESLRHEQASLQHQLTVAQSGVRVSQRQVAQRLRMLYAQGDVTAVEVVLGARSLDDAVTQIDNLNRVTAQGEEVMQQLRSARLRLSATTRELAARAARLEAAQREAVTTAAALERRRAGRNAYIASLAAQRRLNAAQISQIEAQAQAARDRAGELARQQVPEVMAAAVPSAAPAVTDAGGGRSITVSATGYSMGGRTATGLPVGWGVIAVDPGVIPLGTRLTIPGYGEAVAADTGGAVVGAAIDLWFPTAAQAQAWGRRTVTITLH